MDVVHNLWTQDPAISSPLASFLTSFPPRRNCISVVIWRPERSQGTIFEFDSVGCQQLLINSWARARSGCGALDRVLSKRNWCFHNQKSFPDPVPNSKNGLRYLVWSQKTFTQNEIHSFKTSQQNLFRSRLCLHCRLHRHLVSHRWSSDRHAGARWTIWHLRWTVGSDLFYSLEPLRTFLWESGLILWDLATGSWTISELDSVGCQQLSLNS